jgi:hypothetical protein
LILKHLISFQMMSIAQEGVPQETEMAVGFPIDVMYGVKNDGL